MAELPRQRQEREQNFVLGRASSCLAGRVLDAGGFPVRSATVVVDAEKAGVPTRVATTDKSGQYAVEMLGELHGRRPSPGARAALPRNDTSRPPRLSERSSASRRPRPDPGAVRVIFWGRAYNDICRRRIFTPRLYGRLSIESGEPGTASRSRRPKLLMLARVSRISATHFLGPEFRPLAWIGRIRPSVWQMERSRPLGFSWGPKFRPLAWNGRIRQSLWQWSDLGHSVFREGRNFGPPFCLRSAVTASVRSSEEVN